MSILRPSTLYLRQYTTGTLKLNIAHGFNHGLDEEKGYNRFNGLNYVKCDFKVQLV